MEWSNISTAFKHEIGPIDSWIWFENKQPNFSSSSKNLGWYWNTENSTTTQMSPEIYYSMGYKCKISDNKVLADVLVILYSEIGTASNYPGPAIFNIRNGSNGKAIITGDNKGYSSATTRLLNSSSGEVQSKYNGITNGTFQSNQIPVRDPYFTTRSSRDTSAAWLRDGGLVIKQSTDPSESQQSNFYPSPNENWYGQNVVTLIQDVEICEFGQVFIPQMSLFDGSRFDTGNLNVQLKDRAKVWPKDADLPDSSDPEGSGKIAKIKFDKDTYTNADSSIVVNLTDTISGYSYEANLQFSTKDGSVTVPIEISGTQGVISNVSSLGIESGSLLCAYCFTKNGGVVIGVTNDVAKFSDMSPNTDIEYPSYNDDDVVTTIKVLPNSTDYVVSILPARDHKDVPQTTINLYNLKGFTYTLTLSGLFKDNDGETISSQDVELKSGSIDGESNVKFNFGDQLKTLGKVISLYDKYELSAHFTNGNEEVTQIYNVVFILPSLDISPDGASCNVNRIKNGGSEKLTLSVDTIKNPVYGVGDDQRYFLRTSADASEFVAKQTFTYKVSDGATYINVNGKIASHSTPSTNYLKQDTFTNPQIADDISSWGLTKKKDYIVKPYVKTTINGKTHVYSSYGFKGHFVFNDVFSSDFKIEALDVDVEVGETIRLKLSNLSKKYACKWSNIVFSSGETSINTDLSSDETIGVGDSVVVSWVSKLPNGKLKFQDGFYANATFVEQGSDIATVTNKSNAVKISYNSPSNPDKRPEIIDIIPTFDNYYTIADDCYRVSFNVNEGSEKINAVNAVSVVFTAKDVVEDCIYVQAWVNSSATLENASINTSKMGKAKKIGEKNGVQYYNAVIENPVALNPQKSQRTVVAFQILLRELDKNGVMIQESGVSTQKPVPFKSIREDMLQLHYLGTLISYDAFRSSFDDPTKSDPYSQKITSKIQLDYIGKCNAFSTKTKQVVANTIKLQGLLGVYTVTDTETSFMGIQEPSQWERNDDVSDIDTNLFYYQYQYQPVFASKVQTIAFINAESTIRKIARDVRKEDVDYVTVGEWLKIDTDKSDNIKYRYQDFISPYGDVTLYNIAAFKGFNTAFEPTDKIPYDPSLLGEILAENNISIVRGWKEICISDNSDEEYCLGYYLNKRFYKTNKYDEEIDVSNRSITKRYYDLNTDIIFYYNGINYYPYSSMFNDFRYEIFAKNILAGITPYLLRDNAFDYRINQTAVLGDNKEFTSLSEIQKISTNLIKNTSFVSKGSSSTMPSPVPSTEASSQTHEINISNNETLQLQRPSLSEAVNFATATLYEFNIGSDIVQGTSYTLKPGEWIIFYIKESSDSQMYTAYYYGEGQIIKPNNMSIDSSLSESSDASAPANAIRSLVNARYYTEDGIIKPNQKNVTFEYLVTDVGHNTYIQGLTNRCTATKTVSILKRNEVKLNGPIYCYWITNDVRENRYYITVDPDTREYVLQAGEYVIYTDINRSTLYQMGAGSKVKIEQNVNSMTQSLNEFSVDCVNLNAFMKSGLNSLANIMLLFSKEYTLTFTEQEFINVTSGGKLAIGISQFDEFLDKIQSDEVQFSITSKGLFYRGSETDEFVEVTDELYEYLYFNYQQQGSNITYLNNLDKDNLWKIRGYLSLNTSISDPQFLSPDYDRDEGNETQTFYELSFQTRAELNSNEMEFGQSNITTIVLQRPVNDDISYYFLQSNVDLSLVGGQDMILSTYNIDGSIQYPSFYLYKEQPITLTALEQNVNAEFDHDGSLTVIIPVGGLDNFEISQIGLLNGNYLIPIENFNDCVESLTISYGHPGDAEEDRKVLCEYLSTESEMKNRKKYYMQFDVTNDSSNPLIRDDMDTGISDEASQLLTNSLYINAKLHNEVLSTVQNGIQTAYAFSDPASSTKGTSYQQTIFYNGNFDMTADGRKFYIGDVDGNVIFDTDGFTPLYEVDFVEENEKMGLVFRITKKDDVKRQNICIVTNASDSDVMIKIFNVFKYKTNSILDNDQKLREGVNGKLALYDPERRFNYVFQPKESDKIENPLKAQSFEHYNHFYNKFTIDQAKIDNIQVIQYYERYNR